MHEMKRRDFIRGATLGALAFTVGGAQILLTAREARAQGVPFRLLKAGEAETLEALGETLVPGARAAGISHFIDQQLSVPPEEALLEARILNVKPPYANFYRAAIGAIDRASEAREGRRVAQRRRRRGLRDGGRLRIPRHPLHAPHRAREEVVTWPSSKKSMSSSSARVRRDRSMPQCWRKPERKSWCWRRGR